MKKRKGAKPKGPPDLPMDLWTEILVRTPAEDLVRMQLVCRSWHGLITGSRSFARSHSDHWRSRACPGFVVGWESSISVLRFTSTCRGGLRTRSLDFPIQSCERPEVLCSCDGLLLLGYQKSWRLEVYNASTGSRTSLRAPPCVALLGNVRVHGHYQDDWAMVPEAARVGRYKILAITSQDRSAGSRVRTWCYRYRRISKLPRSGKKSGWKELDMHWLGGSWHMEETAHRGGKLRILFSEISYRRHLHMKLVSLDIADERFSDSDPFDRRHRLLRAYTGTRYMSAWNGAFYCLEQSKNELRLWELLEDLDGKRRPEWIQRLSVPPGIPASLEFSTTADSPLLFFDTSRLIVGFGGTSFYVYDRISKEWGRVKTDRAYRCGYKFLSLIAC